MAKLRLDLKVTASCLCVFSDICGMLHFKRSNQNKSFRVNGRALGTVVDQSNLGVQVHIFLKVALHVN